MYQIRILGDLACFTRPEFSTERVSYDVITPSAARGVVEAILWKPAIRWQIHRIAVLAPIQYTQFKRNEVASRTSVRNALVAMRANRSYDYFADEDRQQRNTLALRDVDYAIDVDFVMTSCAGPDDNPVKFDAMFQRRLAKGQFHMQPYLGCREFPARFEPYRGSPTPIEDSRDLGYMLHDLHFGADANRPVFFKARMERGVIEVPEWKEAAA